MDLEEAEAINKRSRCSGFINPNTYPPILERDRAGSRTNGDQLEQDQSEHRGNANCQDGDEIARLHRLIVVVAVIMSCRVSCDAQGGFIEGRALHRTIQTIRFVIDTPTTIRINAHEAVPMVNHHWTAGLIIRN
jgi:hypothetical protein